MSRFTPSTISEVVNRVFSDGLTRSDPVYNTIQSEKAKTILRMMNTFFTQDLDSWCLKRYNPEFDEVGPGPEHPYYRRERYNYQKPDHGCGRFKNSDSAVEYQKKTGNIYVNVSPDKLPRIDSDGRYPWTSYNWSLVSTPKRGQHDQGHSPGPCPFRPLASFSKRDAQIDESDYVEPQFSLIVGRHTGWGASEMGLKHSMLSLANDIWACGELRIFQIREEGEMTDVYQLNLNSSINSTPSISEIPLIRQYQVPIYLYRKMMGRHIRVIFERLLKLAGGKASLVQSVEEQVFFNEAIIWNKVSQIVRPGKLITTGIIPHYGSIDPVHGLLSYYYDDDKVCPDVDSIRALNRMGRGDYYYESTSDSDADYDEED